MFPMIYCLHRNIVNFPCMSRIEYISAFKIYYTNQWEQKTPKTPLPCGEHGPTSNTPIPWPIPLTTPNAIDWCTFAQQRNKVPTGYNGMLHIHPQNCPFPSTYLHPHLIHPSLNWLHSPVPQTASRSNLPFYHSTPSGKMGLATGL